MHIMDKQQTVETHPNYYRMKDINFYADGYLWKGNRNVVQVRVCYDLLIIAGRDVDYKDVVIGDDLTITTPKGTIVPYQIKRVAMTELKRG